MDMYRLRYFCVIAQSGSIRKAADLLRLSPAALSKALHLLEKEVGVKLTVPSGRGLAITDEGRALAQRAEPLLREIDLLSQALQKENRAARPLRIGSFEVFTTHFLKPLLGSLGETSGPLELHELVPGLLEQALVTHAIDVGITYLPIPHPDLDHIQVGRVEMGLYLRKGALGSLDFSDLPFTIPISPVSGSPNRIRGLDGWPDDRFARKIRYRVTLMESALELCREGLAAAYLPRFVVELHNKKVRPEFQLQRRDLPAGMRTESQAVFLVKRRSDPESRIHRIIGKALRKLHT